ncbi:MAG: hypothetical protein AVDCRST_MAG73-3492 [uncultured Thermomicrobiales bacterium]|uniref:Uncharacterized protein n=1 Tax=uncultured Thermomicrobiales bacterium TaxID=1645740 RepID=A0A6J4UWB3_9BACT|nr:MAG: hypothetical protein AVDCRST_MAG73-3492 [uncultured Thermomicrobiales bacterium]
MDKSTHFGAILSEAKNLVRRRTRPDDAAAAEDSSLRSD